MLLSSSIRHLLIRLVPIWKAFAESNEAQAYMGVLFVVGAVPRVLGPFLFVATRLQDLKSINKTVWWPYFIQSWKEKTWQDNVNVEEVKFEWFDDLTLTFFLVHQSLHGKSSQFRSKVDHWIFLSWLASFQSRSPVTLAECSHLVINDEINQSQSGFQKYSADLFLSTPYSVLTMLTKRKFPQH